MSASIPRAISISPTRSITGSDGSRRAPGISPLAPARARPAIPATPARFNEPYGIAVDKAGNLYVADRHNHCVRRVDSASSVITTLAGNGSAGFSGDGGP